MDTPKGALNKKKQNAATRYTKKQKTIQWGGRELTLVLRPEKREKAR